jgi:beta-glucosidase
VAIAKGATKTVPLVVPVKDLAYWDTATHKFVVEPGTYVAEVGASSEDIRVKSEFQVK